MLTLSMLCSASGGSCGYLSPELVFYVIEKQTLSLFKSVILQHFIDAQPNGILIKYGSVPKIGAGTQLKIDGCLTGCGCFDNEDLNIAIWITNRSYYGIGKLCGNLACSSLEDKAHSRSNENLQNGDECWLLILFSNESLQNADECWLLTLFSKVPTEVSTDHRRSAFLTQLLCVNSLF